MDLLGYARLAVARAKLAAVPWSLGFELTHRCNLACGYCDRHQPLPDEMSYEQILRALAELYVLGMRHVSLDGGEPLAHPRCAEVVRFLSSLDVRIYMNTNGVLVPRRLNVVRQLSRVKISLDGPRATHDAVRGRGAFDKAVRGAEAAMAVGVPVEFTCVLGRHNADNISELLDFAEGRRYRIVFQPARPSLFTGGEPVAQALVLTRGECAALLTKLMARKRSGSSVVANHWSSLRHFQRYPEDHPLPCAAGWINATLDPRGDLHHCGQWRRAPGNSVVRLGARRAFRRLTRGGCAQCWCARVVEENYAWGARFAEFMAPRCGPPVAEEAGKRRLPVVD